MHHLILEVLLLLLHGQEMLDLLLVSSLVLHILIHCHLLSKLMIVICLCLWILHLEVRLPHTSDLLLKKGMLLCVLHLLTLVLHHMLTILIGERIHLLILLLARLLRQVCHYILI